MSYVIEIQHPQLKKHRVIKGSDRGVVQRKAQIQMAQWDEQWEKICKRREREETREKNKVRAEQLTSEAHNQLDEIQNILSHTLSVDDAIDWDSLKRRRGSIWQKRKLYKQHPRPRKALIKSLK